MPGKESFALKFLYGSVPGRFVLKIMTSRIVSQICGKILDSGASKCLIPGFVRKNGIRMEEYEKREYSCFNDFFYRQVRSEMRPISKNAGDLIAPCDGRLSAYHITGNTVIPVKQSRYTITELLGGDPAAKAYEDGICLVFRLCVDNYHRYCYLDDGVKGGNFFIPGELHTVRPIALEAVPVFTRNCREYTVMETLNFGRVTQVEVGAMLVGKIVNYMGAGSFHRGEEKGRFEYGGSTVVVLLEKDRVRLLHKLFTNTERGIETRVKMGQKIGQKILRK
ncbi:MAG: phosphatidylserine decarboxylase [Lachnospiraceae bacterium]|nr:phosphatidylserine decarboxylase [Lachnospiraceae bacterium]